MQIIIKIKKGYGWKIAGIIISILLFKGVIYSQETFYCSIVENTLRAPLAFDSESEDAANMKKYAKGLTWTMVRHESGIDKICNWIDILIHNKILQKDNPLQIKVEGIKVKWIEWIRAKEKMIIENTTFDISTLFSEIDINNIKDMKKMTLEVAVEFEKLLEEGSFTGRTAEAVGLAVNQIREQTENAENFITSISKVDIGIKDVNELISFYDEKLLSKSTRENVVIKFYKYDGGLNYHTVTGSYDFDSLIIIGIIDNLVQNAVRIGGPNVNITIKTEMADDKMIKIEISNTAPGMTREILSQIGSQGFTTKEKEQGGIGIYLTLKYIVDMQKGRMRVDTYTEEEGGLSREFSNKIGENEISTSHKNTIGTTWTLYFPLAETKPNITPSNRRIIQGSS